jgi:GH15 family glucan-1,4-alpha-glucosidase
MTSKRALWILLMTISPLQAAAAPTHHALTFANGFGVGVYDLSSTRLTTLRDHVYAHRSASEHTVDLCYDAYFGLRDKGSNLWLGGAPGAAAYVPGTGVVKVTQSHGSLSAEQYFFAPFGLAAPAVVMLARVTASTQTTDAALFSVHNVHLGGGASGTTSERVDYEAATNTFVEQGSTTGRVMLFRGLSAPSKHGATPQNPYTLVQGGGKLVDVQSSGVTNDVVSGFQFDLSLGAGGSAWYGLVMVAGKDKAALTKLLDGYIKGRGAKQLLDDELAAWQAWQKKTISPVGLSADEQAVYAQALATLRMGQCLEPNDPPPGQAAPHGQLVASLPPGKWDIAWVRDGAYAIAALARAGHLQEAEDGLTFMLRGKAGTYVCCDSKGGPYVGTPYAISVTRYYGDGTEESDSNADGPNVEFDNFGLFLWAAGETVTRMPTSEAQAFLAAWYTKLTTGVADVLIKLIDPATGLLRADSSIWEHHWDNGKRRQHTYSNVMAVAGLWQMSKLATLHGKSADAAKYQQASTTLSTFVAQKLVDPKTSILISDLDSLSQGPAGYMDAAVVEAFNFEVLPPAGKVADQTLKAFDQHLGLTTGPGYKRNDDGDTYDEREWVVMDLRVASTCFARKEAARGQKLLDWITGQAKANHDLIPELLDEKTAAFAGEIPMIGFGAGAYALTLFDRAAAPQTTPDGGVPDGATDLGPGEAGNPDAGTSDGPAPADAGSDAAAPPPGQDEGCGCELASPPSTSAGILALLIVLGLLRRRGQPGA